MIKRIIFLTLAIGSLLTAHLLADDLSKRDTLHLQLSNDSINFKSGENSGAFSIDGLHDNDTARFYCRHDVILYSAIDTLNVICADLESPLKISSPNRNITVLLILVAQPDKSKLLKKYPDFGNTAVGENWAFTYMSPDFLKLIELKQKYNLDSVAGSGTETQKIINLMMWTHQIVRHDGNSENPESRNALNLIEKCKTEGRGVNCRMMATILNEAYLSMGFKSRHITCLPYDKTDNDCHVVDIVYSNTLNKWVMMDPTFAGYFMNQDSSLLGIEEIREKMINGEKMILNPNLNWNGNPYDKEEYYYYMAKNLFRFLTPIESSFGYESKEGTSVDIILNPTGYDFKLVSTSDTTNYGKNRLINYYTDNVSYFWAKPK
jgi:hypothetical protein